MKKIFCAVILFCLSGTLVVSQTIDWVTNTTSSNYSTTMKDGLLCDNAGNIIFQTGHKDTSLFCGDETIFKQTSANIFKLSAQGTEIWRKSIYATKSLSIGGITVDDQNSIYVVGWTAVGTDTIWVADQQYIMPDTANNVFLWKMKSDGSSDFFKYFSGSFNGFNDIVVDDQKDIYILGAYEKYFFIGDTVLYSSLTPSGFYTYIRNFFVAKFDSLGDYIKISDLRGSQENSNSGVMNNMAIDAQGNIFMAGSFRDSLKIGSQTIYSSGNSDMVVIKFDGELNVKWIEKDVSPLAGISISDLKVDDAGNVYVSGTYNCPTSFDGITINPVGALYGDAFIVKYDSSASALWTQTLGSTKYLSNGTRIELADDNTLYWGGTYADSTIFGDTVLYVSGIQSYCTNAYISKLSADGDIESVFTINSESPLGNGIQSLDYQSPNTLWVSGIFAQNLIFRDSIILTVENQEAFLLKYGENGVSEVREEFQKPESGVLIFPNPVDNNLIIEKLEGEGSLRIYNCLAEQVFSGDYQNPHVELLLSELLPGVYFLVVEGHTNARIAFIKQ
ncbi:MAG: T9SS type A sorting domain-containing protein [Bacteroidetes bacterium]|nr:T9SS type A sorting domain-containing protein [Bacteroidota bacterium]MBU1720306.1 T9SS type A sorting domain-containing protein [Bacteroidota bacterium]